MNWIQNLPIRTKVVLIIMIISSAALVAASAALMAYDYVEARRELQSSAGALAQIVGDNTSAAVSFNDPATAADTLGSLRKEPWVVAACVYKAGSLFAQFRIPGEPECPQTFSDPDVQDRRFSMSSPIEVKGTQIGTVRIRATLAPVYARLRLDAIVIIAVLLIVGLLALVLSSFLQRLISTPILELAETATAVSKRKDYSIRAGAQSGGELGTLIRAFNDMLAQIEARDSELLRANRMKDEFLMTLSHELRTPLTAISGWVQMLRTRNMEQEAVAKAVTVIDRNVRAQMRLIEDLLNVSQIISGKFRIRCEWIDPIKIVRDAVENARSSAEAKRLDLRLEIGADAGGLIFADPSRLQQIMWNLLANSVKFTSHGSIVTRVDRVGDHLQIEVQDTGEGISSEYLPHVFERFTQADSSTTRRHGGLGLGLSLVRQLVELHGGVVAARSEGLGRGSTFRITFPAPQNNRVPRPVKFQPAPAPDDVLAGLRILLVDDDPDAREMIAHALRGSGAAVDQAASAAEALDRFAASAPDVLVSDIGMPVMDGCELMSRLRTTAAKLPPALALTAYASNSDIDRVFSAGFQAHLSKPVQLQSLINTVAGLAGRASRAS